jgi:hypothetical protein
MMGGAIGNTLVGKGHTKLLIAVGYVLSVGALVP